jgi:hypothetical protein
MKYGTSDPEQISKQLRVTDEEAAEAYHNWQVAYPELARKQANYDIQTTDTK